MAAQRRKVKQRKPPTLGGAKLHEIRNTAGLSLLDLAAQLETDLGKAIDAAHINKIETGSIKKPQAETLEVILTGLHARYSDRRAVLEAFGYSFPWSLPIQDEIEEMRTLSVSELNDATYPMLLIDFGHRLLGWNRYAPRIIGRHPDDPTLDSYYGVTTFELVFDPALGGRLLVENPAEFAPAWLGMVKADLYVYRHEPWFAVLLERIRRLPGFSEVWDSLPEGQVRFVSPVSIVPLWLNVPGTGVLQFRLSTADFLFDSRFQIIHFTPFGAQTLRVCALWAEEEGKL